MEAFEQHGRAEVVIVPIIADSCHWWDFPRLKDLQALPAEAKAIELDPRYVDAFTNRAHAHENLGQLEEAVKDFHEGIRLLGERIELRKKKIEEIRLEEKMNQKP